MKKVILALIAVFTLFAQFNIKVKVISNDNNSLLAYEIRKELRSIGDVEIVYDDSYDFEISTIYITSSNDQLHYVSYLLNHKPRGDDVLFDQLWEHQLLINYKSRANLAKEIVVSIDSEYFERGRLNMAKRKTKKAQN